MLEAIKNHHSALEYLDSELRKDYEFMSKASALLTRELESLCRVSVETFSSSKQLRIAAEKDVSIPRDIDMSLILFTVVDRISLHEN